MMMASDASYEAPAGAVFAGLDTPCLLLDRRRMDRNIARLRGRLQKLNTPLRPHLKTAKSIDVARLLMNSPQGPATVSTLREAEAFADAGVRDILYAVGIAPGKLGRVIELRKRGVDVCVILDNVGQARAVAAASAEATQNGAATPIPALIEIDSDGHRAGVPPNDPLLIEIGTILHRGGAELRGVMTHAGASYDCRTEVELVAMAEQERASVVRAAEKLRAAGLPSPVVSVGSSPTAHFARDLTGVTEVRAGVFVFFDLVMAGIGVCQIDDIALSVLASVIGHQTDKRQIIVDAGWMALSRDRGTSGQNVDQGYGLVCDVNGVPYSDLIVKSTNQEHGLLEIRDGSSARLPDLLVGSLVRILPNHACATAAQHSGYVVFDGERIAARWPRIPAGW